MFSPNTDYPWWKVNRSLSSASLTDHFPSRIPDCVTPRLIKATENGRLSSPSASSRRAKHNPNWWHRRKSGDGWHVKWPLSLSERFFFHFKLFSNSNCSPGVASVYVCAQSDEGSHLYLVTRLSVTAHEQQTTLTTASDAFTQTPLSTMLCQTMTRIRSLFTCTIPHIYLQPQPVIQGYNKGGYCLFLCQPILFSACSGPVFVCSTILTLSKLSKKNK